MAPEPPDAYSLCVRILLGLTLLLPSLALPAAAAKHCHPAAEAEAYAGKDVCIAAHVYDIAQLRDGTRFLDICSPDTSDDACRFTIASLPEDTRDVGDLSALRGQDIELRGTVHSVNQRSLMYLSSARQLHGGAEKFHPNPVLLSGFSADDSKPPVHDPSLSGSTRHASVFRASH
jgi:hypothetical protein